MLRRCRRDVVNNDDDVTERPGRAFCQGLAHFGLKLRQFLRHIGIRSGFQTLGQFEQAGGIQIVADGIFALDPAKEQQLVAHLKAAELYASAEPKDGVFSPPIDFPPHERCVEIEIDLCAGAAEATVIGADLTHEYVSENADYRS